ncbi:conserved hypothetical protein [Pediculus humanus corporis]|uniref:Uncharacterized protein n=1 Tax=Pediculus humanus subsp. corporis TaxID=121224 RepID=E0VZL8_PEDHC|nr:uncharacterized protein Phum_PHUM536070 [Pediculus humanus corporis]EEB18824.1 conserved hypothetical protein [Pediculus humanus corporis]
MKGEEREAENYVRNKVRFFWHISDIHYDINYSLNGDSRKRKKDSIGSPIKPMGMYGDYQCDSPWALVESAVHTMKSKHGDVDFILWTGDGLTHFGGGHLTRQQLQTLQNVTDLLRHTFVSQFVFPVLGREDSPDPVRRFKHIDKGYRELADLWRHWLPTEAIQTFTKGGYYTIEQKERKLRLVALNTNLFSGSAGPDEDPGGQWSWLESVLAKSSKNRETVYLVGHIPPGVDERQGGGLPPSQFAYQHRFNRKYLQLVRKYSETIVGQFFGHLHSDTFRIVYSDTGVPVSWMFLSPAVSPKRTTTLPNNPGLRLYKFNTNTGKVLDYMQIYLDLKATHARGTPNWEVEYNFTHYYGLNEISAISLHDLVESFRTEDSELFIKYFRANSVRYLPSPKEGKCFSNCLHNHFCAITRLDYQDFERCVETTASALASAVSFLNFNSNRLIQTFITTLLVVYVFFLNGVYNTARPFSFS